MSRLSIVTKDKAQITIEALYKDLERRIVASPPGYAYLGYGKYRSKNNYKCMRWTANS